jgi:uncharacterized protein
MTSQQHEAPTTVSAAGGRRADACGEVPAISLVTYNIERLRAIGYLDRFSSYLRQIGLPEDAGAAVSHASPEEIDALVRRAAEQSKWGADPEAHLDATDCGTVLVTGDDASNLPGVRALDTVGLLDDYAAMRHSVSFLIGVNPLVEHSLSRALDLTSHPACGGIAVSPFLTGSPLSGEIFAPVLQAAADRGLAVWAHSSAHFRPDVAYDIGHPRHVDAALRRWPGLRLIIGHAGWPWTDEACIVALRHPSVAIEFSTFPPRLLPEPGWSLSPLLANKDALAGRVFFGSGQVSSPDRLRRLFAQLSGLDLGSQEPSWRGEGLISWLTM